MILKPENLKGYGYGTDASIYDFITGPGGLAVIA